MKLPIWVLHTGIALNTVMFMGFYVGKNYQMSLISFLSACAFWLHLILRQKEEENE